MPHASIKLRAGVDTNETPALNETSFSQTNLIRFFYSPDGMGLPQKLGGWTRFFASTTTAIVRALWAWEDTEATAHLAFGTETIGSTFQSQLGVITDGGLKDISPTSSSDNVTPAVETVAGDSIVTITDMVTTNITQYDSVYIPAHISIGGLILFGLYRCDPDGFFGTNTYTIQAMNALDAPLPAPANDTSPTVAEFTTTSGDSNVVVTLVNHGYNVGDTYPVLIPTTVGGIVLYGNYLIFSVTDADNFVITGSLQATASTSGFINGGDARYVYSFGVGSIGAGVGYGIGGYGVGGYGTGSTGIPSLGSPIGARDWTLDNWGKVLVACPIKDPVVLTTTAASGDGTTGTLTFLQTYTAPVGEVVTVTGITPTSWNGTYTVTASTSSSISFLTAVVAAQTGAGSITIDAPPFQPIYQWDPESGAPTATIIAEAPPVSDGMFVAMPERQIVAWGSTFTGIADPLLIRWCDINNYNVWIGTFTNQAGSFRIPRGSKIVAGIQGPQQGLIWTDVGIWSMQYINQPLIYSFNEVGYGCGLIARKAAGVINGVVYWMGPSQFYALSGDGVEPVACPVWDVIFQDLDQTALDKIRVAVNSRFGEVAWYYPSQSGGTGEVDSYVKYNIYLQAWDYGLLARSAWIDQSVLGPPIGSDPTTRLIYQHETSPDADGQAMNPSFRTGYAALDEAEMKTFIDQVWPDMKWGFYNGAQNATVNLTFYTADYPGDDPIVYGPFALTQNTKFITPRFRGRLVAFEMGSTDVGSWWRLGAMRYRGMADGKF